MKILLDHNLDRRLKSQLPQQETFTTQEMGWANVVNGKLLALAEENGFDIFLTADSNIKSQQNISGRKISILIMRTFDNRLSTNLEMREEIEEVLSRINQREILEIFHSAMNKS